VDVQPHQARRRRLVKALWWQAPTLLNPHFANGTKDQDACRIFYEPLASYDFPTATSFRSSRPRRPASRTAGREGRMSVTWKLKKNVVWHDGKPFTADDVRLQLGVRDGPGTAAVTIGPYRDIVRIDKLDSHTVKIVFKSPAPFWSAPFCGAANGVIIPKHLFQAFKGDKSREAPKQPQAGRHRPLQVRRLQARRHRFAARSTRTTTCPTGPSSTRWR